MSSSSDHNPAEASQRQDTAPTPAQPGILSSSTARVPWLRTVLALTACVMAARMADTGAYAREAGTPDNTFRIEGRCVVPSIVGQADCETLPLSPSLVVLERRGGAGSRSLCDDDGRFTAVLEAGVYDVLVSPAGPIYGGQVFEGVEIAEGTKTLEFKLTPDYHCAARQPTDWHRDPWVRGRVFEQSFIVLGNTITHISFRLAPGERQPEESIKVAVSVAHKSSPIGKEQTVEAVPNKDTVVTWRPGELKTQPGGEYVVRVAVQSGSEPVAIYARRDHGFGYSNGQLIADGQAARADAFMYVGGSSNGTYTHAAAPGEPAPRQSHSACYQTFTAAGVSAAGALLTFEAGQPPGQLNFSLYEGGPDGPALVDHKQAQPIQLGERRFSAGVVWPRGKVGIEPGKRYAVVVAAGPAETSIPASAPVDVEGGQYADSAIAFYEYAEQRPAFVLPPAPPPLDWEFAEVLPMVNSGFERGDQQEWENAWGGGQPFTKVVSGTYLPEQFRGESAEAIEGKHCAVIEADHEKVSKLIRRRFSWPFRKDVGLFHARVWVASPDNASEAKHPLTVRLTVSAYGSMDAGNVRWSEAMVSPGNWTMLQCRPVVPAGRSQTVFVLIEGGSEDEVASVKIDDLQIVIDEK